MKSSARYSVLYAFKLKKNKIIQSISSDNTIRLEINNYEICKISKNLNIKSPKTWVISKYLKINNVLLNKLCQWGKQKSNNQKIFETKRKLKCSMSKSVGCKYNTAHREGKIYSYSRKIVSNQWSHFPP